MPYKITSTTATEPLTLAEMKSFLRVEHSADDVLIEAMITSARAQAELLTGRALAAHTVEEFFDSWPESGLINLSLSPVVAVGSVAYVASGAPDVSVYTPIAASNYVVDMVSEPSRIVPRDSYTLPSTEPVPNAIKVTYSASPSGDARVFDVAKMYIRFIVSHDYERRTDPITRTSRNTVRRTEQLIRQIKLR